MEEEQSAIGGKLHLGRFALHRIVVIRPVVVSAGSADECSDTMTVARKRRLRTEMELFRWSTSLGGGQRLRLRATGLALSPPLAVSY
jgi:hypothetical protein